jgi:uncharacterized protein DUF4431
MDEIDLDGRTMTKFPPAFALCLALAVAAPASATCLSYANRVSITGTLTRTVFPGRPNFESVAKGDEPETYFVLRLNPPACVDADPTDAEIPAKRGITEIQLLLSSEQYAELRPKLGQRIGLSGVLFPAQTGHHHTPVILEKVQFGR